MNSILTSITNHTGETLLVLLILIIGLAGITIRQSMLLSQHNRRWIELLSTAKGSNLEDLLHQHLSERQSTSKDILELQDKVKTLEKKVQVAKRHLGIVRYDAFPEVGGNQSFAMALYDDNGNGAIINSIIGRVDCRVYCKPLQNGKSERNLSTEEIQAIEDAVSLANKGILSY